MITFPRAVFVWMWLLFCLMDCAPGYHRQLMWDLPLLAWVTWCWADDRLDPKRSREWHQGYLAGVDSVVPIANAALKMAESSKHHHVRLDVKRT